MGQKVTRLEEVNEAAENGDLDFLIMTHQKFELLPDVMGANAAAISGRLHVIQWLAERRTPILPNNYGRRMAMMTGQYHVIKWLSKNSKESSDGTGENNADPDQHRTICNEFLDNLET